MSLIEQIGRLKVISLQIQHSALFEKARLVESLSGELIAVIEELAQRVEKLERGERG